MEGVVVMVSRLVERGEVSGFWGDDYWMERNVE